MVSACAVIVAALLTTGCDVRSQHAQAEEGQSSRPAPWELDQIPEDPELHGRHIADEAAYADTAVRADSLDADGAADDAPASAIQTGGLGNLATFFNDSNKYHYAAAERIGIRPIRNVADAYYLRRPLVKIETNRWYELEELTHSMPYLVPEAAKLLEDIGRNFHDSLVRRGMGTHRIRVTSVLRSAHSVKKLRRVNRNATDSSTHQLATTFDISYARFAHDANSPQVSDEQLKYVLAEVLRDLRQQNRCLVKFERKSPCFHISATGK